MTYGGERREKEFQISVEITAIMDTLVAEITDGGFESSSPWAQASRPEATRCHLVTSLLSTVGGTRSWTSEAAGPAVAPPVGPG